MKKSKVFLISVLVTVLVMSVCAVVFIIETNRTGVPENDVILFDDYCIYRSSDVHSKIYLRANGENKTVDSAWIYKYAFDGDKKVIAYRKITAYEGDIYNLNEQEDVIYCRYYGAAEYGVSEDLLILYDCSEEKYLEFETDEELAEYCGKNGIALCDWYYPAGNGFMQAEKTQLSDDYYLKTWTHGYSSVMCGENELYFGYISDIKTEGNTVSFRLRQTKNEYSPEHMTANVGLSALSGKPIGKFRKDFLYYDDIYYDKIITVNTVTGETTERDK